MRPSTKHDGRSADDGDKISGPCHARKMGFAVLGCHRQAILIRLVQNGARVGSVQLHPCRCSHSARGVERLVGSHQHAGGLAIENQCFPGASGNLGDTISPAIPSVGGEVADRRVALLEIVRDHQFVHDGGGDVSCGVRTLFPSILRSEVHAQRFRRGHGS